MSILTQLTLSIMGIMLAILFNEPVTSSVIATLSIIALLHTGWRAINV